MELRVFFIRYLSQGIGFIGGERVDTPHRVVKDTSGISNGRKPFFGLEGNGGDSVNRSQERGPTRWKTPSGNWDHGKR